MDNRIRKIMLLGIACVTALTMAQGITPARAQKKTTVNWFVGLGAGTLPPQLDAQNKFVADFNASHPDIELKIQIDASNQQAPDDMAVLVSSGQAPDIVGPVGFSGANLFAGQWLDLQPLVDKTKYDLKQFDPALVQLYQDPKEGLIGIPFAVYPGLIYYNQALFDDAGLKYPPAKFGDKYSLDGKDVDWTWDTLATVAKRLTFDSAGNDATNAKFDPSKTVQYGFVHQYGTIRSEFQTFGGAPVVDPTSGKVKFPDSWRAEAQWLYNGLWKDHFIPSAAATNSDLLKPSEFASGKVGMARTMSWYTCCLADAKFKWDLGTVPQYNGKYYAPADADTFRIMKQSKNPEAAFTVLQYMLGDGALPLLQVYGAYPARPDLQPQFIKVLGEKFPSVTHWDLLPASLGYAVAPHHESYFPNFPKGQLRFADFRTLLYGETGKSMDVNKEMDKLQSDLQAIIDQGSSPAAAATMAATAAK